MSLFGPEERPALEFQFLLSSSLDIFEARMPHKTADQGFGLLQAIDERLAMYGWLTNTGVKLVIIVDMEGRPVRENESKNSAVTGLKDSDLKPVSLYRFLTRTLFSFRRWSFTQLMAGLPCFAKCIHRCSPKSILRPR